MKDQHQRADRGAARKRRRDGIVGLLLLLGAVGLVAFFFAFPWFDTLDQRWTRCEVVDAQPFQGDNTSMQPWKVQIETSDCRNVIYTEGITEDNVQEIADSIQPGAYELKMSWMSRRLAEGWLPTTAPAAQDYRRIQ